MKILHLNPDKKWVPVEKRYYNDEAQLQDLLTNDVNTLPLDEIGYDSKFVTIGKEVSLQNGALDVLAVSPQGHIALIETKLEKNPEVKRTVVGQILGYAAYLWNKSYEEIESSCFRKFLLQRKVNFQGSLSEYMKEKIGEENFSESEFKEGLEKRLRLGSFTLLIVVDQANQELKDIANYLNDRTGQEIDFYVVEMQLVGDAQEHFLIPSLANPPRKNITYSEKSKSNDSYDRTPIAKEDFIKLLSQNGKRIAEALLKKFESEESVEVVWRKNGFSLMTKYPKDLAVPGYTTKFSFLFFKAPSNEQDVEELQFGYCEWPFENIPKLKPFISEYVDCYRTLPSYDEKRKAIKDLDLLTDDKISGFIALIEKTVKSLNSKV